MGPVLFLRFLVFEVVEHLEEHLGLSGRMSYGWLGLGLLTDHSHNGGVDILKRGIHPSESGGVVGHHGLGSVVHHLREDERLLHLHGLELLLQLGVLFHFLVEHQRHFVNLFKWALGRGIK